MKLSRFFLSFVIVSMLLVLVLASASQAHADSLVVRRRNSQSQSISFMQIAGGNIVKQDGTQAYLDGLNYKDQFKSRLNEDMSKTADWKGIQDDFGGMASLGAKTIRVWFNWIYYEPTPGQLDHDQMTSHMQKVVDIAKANGLFIVITIYVKNVWNKGAPVANWLQADATSAKTDPDDPNFWLNDGDFPGQQRALFVNLWSRISSQFKNEPTIAAYDLINEPFNKYYDQQPSWVQGVPDSDPHYPLKSLYDLALSAVRANGDNHIVILDYNWVYTYDMVFPRPSSDGQVLYDVHFYNTAAGNSVQGWDVTQKSVGPWSGKAPTGEQVSYTYPDVTSAHDKTALRSRFTFLVNAQLGGYPIYIGEFGLTENTSYNTDVASLVVELGFAGLTYFEYCSDETIGAVQVLTPIMAFIR